MCRRWWIVALVCIPACMEDSKPESLRLKREPAERLTVMPREEPSLYTRLGGEDGITKVVDDFVVIIAGNEKIDEKHRKHFREGNVDLLKKRLVNQIGEATGGPQVYTGKNMKDAHAGLGLTNLDFDLLVADLKQALDQNGVAGADRDELLGMLETMRPDVVERP